MAIATVPTQETVAIAETAKSPMPLRARLVLDGEVHDGTFLFVIGCNTKFAGRDMKLAPRADIGDGKIDVVVLRHASRLQLLRLLRGVFSDSHLSHACGGAQSTEHRGQSTEGGRTQRAQREGTEGQLLTLDTVQSSGTMIGWQDQFAWNFRMPFTM